MTDEQFAEIKRRLADWLLSDSEDAIRYGESIAFLLADDERLRRLHVAPESPPTPA